ncbi:Spo11/DNA topoisomerase VI subunit A [Collybia nuda]|uniref:DNA topoisomerase (ATP-hydrolyzing) n=1 Tax=Collybia nuda TaxID=64659 RepID=A0A9P6CDW8_9AGAR|nr:Spo11/DNA topoisomerase VI subunit A [Collybia nuda]
MLLQDLVLDCDSTEHENVMESDTADSGSEVGSSPTSTPDSSMEAVDCIEDMVFSLLSQLAFSGRATSPTVFNSKDLGTCESEEIGETDRKLMTQSKIELQLVDRSKEAGSSASEFRCITYPRKNPKGSAKPLAQLFRVLDLAHEAVINGVPVTKRDIYYKDVPLFKKQRVVDDLVDDVAATFGLGRSDLNIRATSKGLVCGSGLTICLQSGEVLHGSLIPVGEDIETFRLDEDVTWVLIVEKDAVFQTLCRLNLVNNHSLPGRGIIITGKGYPDVATRHLVKSLADALPMRIPIVALVDGDPHGLDILSVYKYGSQRLRHESNKLAAMRVKWLGLWASELERFGIDRDKLLPITQHDEKKALTMLRRHSCIMPRKWRRELMYMLHIRCKAEIEILSTMKIDLSTHSDYNHTLKGQNEDFHDRSTL